MIGWKLAVLPQVLCNVEYQEDGSSGTMWKQYLKNPKGFAFWRKICMRYPESKKRKIVVANEDIELYKAIKDLVKNPEKILYYKQQAEFRGNYFSTEGTVKKVEEMIENL